MIKCYNYLQGGVIMFDKIKEAFETYSQSSVTHTDPTLRSFDVKIGQAVLANRIIDILKSLKYKTIRYNEVFHELFTSKAGFEVTIHLLQSRNGSTTIEVSVFSPTNRGKTRKALRFLLHKFKEEFNGLLAHD